MNISNDNTPRPGADEDVVVLGTVSSETMGGAGMRIEDLGFVTAPGIAED